MKINTARDILKMSAEDLISVNHEDLSGTCLGAEEIIHIARMFNFFWEYDYKAAREGKVGLHAVLKSGLHSDGFIAMKMLLKIPNIRELLAYQLALQYGIHVRNIPDSLIGIPDAATDLARDLGKILGVRAIGAAKVDGNIVISDPIENDEFVLIIEDVTSSGTGFREVVTKITQANPNAIILPYELVLFNRGGLKELSFGARNNFSIISVAERKMLTWSPQECPLCKRGSCAIKPKATEENWQAITTSQL